LDLWAILPLYMDVAHNENPHSSTIMYKLMHVYRHGCVYMDMGMILMIHGHCHMAKGMLGCIGMSCSGGMIYTNELEASHYRT
jgi:hypothetical protein